MLSWKRGLTGPALRIASKSGRRLQVVAGPGTGKSFALMRRIARLLEEGSEPTRILAVTFTRNAAASLVDDLSKLGVPGCNDVVVGTLHSYCFSLLNQERAFKYIRRVPRPLIAPDRQGSLQFEGGIMTTDLSVLGKFGGKRGCTKRIRAFEAAWARLQSELPGWPKEPTDKYFEQQLIDWLVFHRAMLIGELIPLALRYLRDNPTSAALTAFDHVIVDEYQDLNRAEQEVIDLVASSGNSAIVGDEDQSIYSFRHAHPEGIDDFKKRNPSTYDESLTECRRCPTRVVAIADELIRANYPAGHPPRIRPMVGNRSGKVHIVQWHTPEDEARGLVQYIEFLLSQEAYEPSDVMVITPRRQLGYRMRDMIRDKGIPVHSFYHDEALDEVAAQRSFTLLSLLANRDDRVALRWWLGSDSPTGLRAQYRRLRDYCERSGESPGAALEAVSKGKVNTLKVPNLVTKFRDLKNRLAAAEQLSLPNLVDLLFPDGDADLSTLRDLALLELADAQNAQELLYGIKTSITQPEIVQGDFVSVMSPQKSKGLTAKVVIVTGCIEGVMPFVRDDLPLQQQADLRREQRRLFYVAITRCANILVISSFTHLDQSLAFSSRIPFHFAKHGLARSVSSSFLSELGPSAPGSRTGSSWASAGYT